MGWFTRPKKLFEKGCSYKRNGIRSREFTIVFDWPMEEIKYCVDVKWSRGRWLYFMEDSIGWMDYDAHWDFKSYFEKVSAEKQED